MQSKTVDYRPWRTTDEFDEAELLQWRLALLRHQIDATEVTAGYRGPALSGRSLVGEGADSPDPMQGLLHALGDSREAA